jgi:PleD family two-component response regulator
VAQSNPIILVVEDDLDVAEMLTTFFRVQGYEVMTANWGEDALHLVQKTVPNIVILDIRLPDIDGYEVARRLRTNRRTREIPILFLTDKRGRDDRLHGLQIGGDDYITKPFDNQELRLRVRNALQRASQSSLLNPVTGLPEGVLVDEKLSECLESGVWGALLVAPLHLDHFREDYGFVAADDVLRAITLMIRNALQEHGALDAFIGQLSENDFAVITDPTFLPELQERLRVRLNQSLGYFYPLHDREMPAPEERLAIHIKQLSSLEFTANSLSQFKQALLE